MPRGVSGSRDGSRCSLSAGPEPDLAEDDSPLSPQFVLQRLGEIAGPEAVYVAGVGQHQMWAAQFVQYERPNAWINSGGLGTMGYAVPAAMGAKVSQPDRTVWAVDGDGCFQMTNQELATCTINDIPIKVAVINNSSLGMVRQWQTLFYNERYSNTDLHTSHAGSGCRTSSSSPTPTAASACGASGPRTSTTSSPRRWPSTTARSSSTSSSTATRWCGRWCLPVSATTSSRSPGRSAPVGSRGVRGDRAGSRRRPRRSLRTERNYTMSTHTLSVLVENKPGVLARIASLFSRRGFNISSLAVGETERPEISRMTVVVDVEDLPLEQVTKQLNKLVEVLKVVELEPSSRCSARSCSSRSRPMPAPAARSSRWSRCSAPRSLTSPPSR